MSVETVERVDENEALPPPSARRQRGRRSTKPGLALLAQGEPFVWLTGGALVVCVGMILGLLLLVLLVGTQTFWPKEIIRVEQYDGRVHMGEVTVSDEFRLALDAAENGSTEIVRVAMDMMGDEFDISTEGKTGEVVEVLVRKGQIVSADTQIMRLKQAGKQTTIKAGHAGQIIELNYEPGDSLAGDSEKPLARIKASFDVSAAEVLLPANVVEVSVNPTDQVEVGDKLARVETADGQSITFTTKDAGQVTAVEVKVGDRIESFDSAILMLKPTSTPASKDRDITIASELAPARISDVYIKEMQHVERDAELAQIKMANGIEVTVKAPQSGQIIGVFGKSENTIAEMNTPLVKLKTKGEVAINSHRRKIQTGNFKLSNKHFDWVEDYSIVPEGESRPEWAIVVERVEGGKFYGIPTEFAVRTEREVPSEEAELQKIVQYFDSKNYLLFEVTDAAAKEDPDATAKRAKELLGKHELTAEQLLNTTTLVQPLREKLKVERQKNVAAFVSKFKPAASMRVDAVLEGGKKVMPIADVKLDDNVVEVQEVFVGSTAAWEKYEEYHQQVRDRFDEWYGLKKHDVGRINAREEKARLKVQQEELDQREFDSSTGLRTQTVFIVDSADGLWDAKNQELRPLDKAMSEYDETVAAVEQRVGGRDEDLVRTALLIRDLLADEIDALKAPTLERTSRLRESLAEAPESSQAVVEDFLAIKQAALDDQQTLEAKMAELVKENDRYQLRAETTTTESLFSNVSVTAEDLAVLRDGKLPDTLRQSFESYGETFGDDVSVEESPVSGKFYLTDATDPNRVNKLIVSVKDGKASGMKYAWKTLSLNNVVRAYPANQLSTADRLGIYFSRWGEFLFDDPREANSAGGVFPAIWGTIAMTIIMSFIVVPFGVLASLYLREYAKGGVLVSAVRISINNLAGVPSIVFGVFGLGFFILVIGAYVDGGPIQADFSPWPPAKWFAFLGLTAVLAVGAFFFGLSNIIFKDSNKKDIKSVMSFLSMLLWLGATIVFFVVVFKTPYFTGFNEAKLPNPTLGKEGMLWASLTLALLTLPVVIVATEEALSAVPNSLREGSYASGASKWQTIRRIVLPHAMPGIMTGMILAMARGAGEVAPLMLVGVKKATSELPFDGNFPYMHVDRSFMHLGFHIYDIGFQSQNSEAAKPMVYTTTLLLIAIIASLNLAAIAIRSRLRRRFKSAQF